MVKYWRGLEPKQRKNHLAVLLALAMLLLVFATRLPGLSHGADLHPDEFVIVDTAASVAYGNYEYTPTKAYPEGAAVLHIPFQVLGRLVSTALGLSVTTITVARLAAVVYFMAGCALGFALCWRLSRRSLLAVGVYAFTMVFSLFHLEQSRYATAEPVTFFLLMLLLWLVYRYAQGGQRFHLVMSGVVAGMLAAAKYPLVLFFALPVVALYTGRGATQPRAKWLLYLVLALVGGFLLCSPSVREDPAFLMRVLFGELTTYTQSVAPELAGTPLHHIATTLVYQLFFSDLPLALPFAVGGFILLRRTHREHGHAGPLFTVALPVLMLAFVAMNLLANLFFFRTLYPWFLVCNLYAALGVAAFVRRVRWRQVGVVALCAFTLVRSGLFVHSLMQPSARTAAVATLTGHPAWEARGMTVVLGALDLLDDIGVPERQYIYSPDAFMNEEPKLMAGEFAISGLMETYYTRGGIWPDEYRAQTRQREAGWEAFKAANAASLIGTVGDTKAQLLYGGFLNGSTLPQFEFPVYQLYYNGEGAGGSAERFTVYNGLYEQTDPATYFEELEQLQGVTIVAAWQGPQPLVTGALPGYLQPDGAQSGHLVVAQNGERCYAKTGEALEDVDLSEAAGIECVASSYAGPYDPHQWTTATLRIGGRLYHLPYNGVQMAVYDQEFGTVMDWFVVLEGADGAKIVRH